MSSSLGATCRPPAARQQQDETVWALLLDIWQPLDQQLVLQLMCCSKSMMDLVHSQCAGRLDLRVFKLQGSSSPPAVLTSWPQHNTLRRWLAKHARLCSSINLSIMLQYGLPQVQGRQPNSTEVLSALDVLETSVASGLEAAVAGHSNNQQPCMTRQQALAITRQQALAALTLYPTASTNKGAAAAAAAAVAAVSAPPSSYSGQPLLLAHFASSIPSQGRILRALAGYKQLTSLQLQLGGKRQSGVRSKPGLAALTGLRELVLTAYPGPLNWDHGNCYDTQAFPAALSGLSPALPSLTGLTRLAMGWVPAQRVLDMLPVGLVELDLGSKFHMRVRYNVNLGHLTAVTKLRFPALGSSYSRVTVLPPKVRILDLASGWTSVTVKPLMQLQHLQQLAMKQIHLPGSYLAMMQELCGLTQVTHFSLTCLVRGMDHEISFSWLPMLPKLKHLQLRSYQPLGGEQIAGLSAAVDMLGTCTELTCLKLQDLALCVPVAYLAAQLTQLPALQELSVVRVHAPLVSAACLWEPLWQAVSELASLRSFTAHELLFEGGAGALAAATQLTHLELVGCGVSEGIEAELRAGLTQLSRSMLVVR